MEDRISLREIISNKLEEARMIGVDAAALIKELQAGCAHEKVARTDGSHDLQFGIKDPQIKCLICGFTEDCFDTQRTTLNRHKAIKISREEFERLGIIPPLKKSAA